MSPVARRALDPTGPVGVMRMRELQAGQTNEAADPRQFFEIMLRPAYEAWLEQPYQEWRAKAAVSFANALAERLAICLGYPDGARAYRQYLTDHVCPEFGWVWDVADSLKHLRLTRLARRVSSAGQTSFRVLKIDDWSDLDKVDDFDGHGVIIVTADDGSERDLADLMAKVMTMFQELLKQHDL